MNNYMPNIIKDALEEIGKDDLFYLIEKTRTWYYDALVWFNLKTLKIEVDAIPHGDYPCPCGPRILLHREEAMSTLYGIEDGIMCLGIFDDNEMNTIENEFGGNINRFLASMYNSGGTLEERIQDKRKALWDMNWYETINDWAYKASMEIEEQKWQDEMEDAINQSFGEMLAAAKKEES